MSSALGRDWAQSPERQRRFAIALERLATLDRLASVAIASRDLDDFLQTLTWGSAPSATFILEAGLKAEALHRQD